MASSAQKITLSGSRDIPFNKLVLSQSNVRRVKAGVSNEELAEDIAQRTLLQSLSVRPVLDAEGNATGMFEIPAGGRRFRALELLMKQKRLAKTALVPCVVREAGLAEEESLAENVHRIALHPLDQFRAFQALRERGLVEEEIAAARSAFESAKQRFFNHLITAISRDVLRQLYVLLVMGKVEGRVLQEFEDATGLKLTDSAGIKDNLPPITTFLNRLLALTIDLQNILFTAFEQLLTARIEGAIASGTYDVGLETLNAESFVVTDRRTIYTHPGTSAETRLLTITHASATGVAFQIVLGPEESLTSGLPLAFGDRAQGVETARDSGQEPLLSLHIGRDRSEQRRLRLIGSVGATQSLDRGIGVPSRLQEIVDAEPPVLRRQFRVIGSSGAAGLREHEDALDVVHEGLRLAEIRGARAVLDDEAVDAVRSGLADDAPRAAGQADHAR
jgi:hypothetical protein